MDDATIARLAVKIGADTAKLRSEMARAKSSTSFFAREIKKLGPMIAGAFAIGSIGRFASTSLKAYDVQQKNEAALRTALKGREDATQKLIQQAAQLQKMTLFGDEETIRAQSLLAAFVKEEEQIKKVIPLVQDFATAKGMDLAGAADLVAKTLGSSTNALSRYGIQIEGEVGSTQRLEATVRGLSDAFGGQAEAAAKAGLGPLKQLGNAWGDLKESAGGLLAKGILPVAEGLRDLVGRVNDVLARPLSKKMNDERIAANGLALQLMDVNLSEERRRQLYDELSKIAPEIVKDIKEEAINYDTLRANLQVYNEELMRKIALQKQSEAVAKAEEKAQRRAGEAAQAQIDLLDAQTQLIEKVSRDNKDLGVLLNSIAYDETKSLEERAAAIGNLIPPLQRTRKIYKDFASLLLIVESNNARLTTAERKANDERQESIRLFRQLNGIAPEITDDQIGQIKQYKELVDNSRKYNVALTEQELRALEVKQAENELKAQMEAAATAAKLITDETDKAGDVSKSTKKSVADLKAEWMAETAILPKLQKELEYLQAVLNTYTADQEDDIRITNESIKAVEKQISYYKDLSAVIDGIGSLQAITKVQVKQEDIKPFEQKPVTLPLTFELPEQLKGLDFGKLDFRALITGLDIFTEAQREIDYTAEAGKMLGESFNMAGKQGEILTGAIESITGQIVDLVHQGFTEADPEVKTLIDLLNQLRAKLESVNNIKLTFGEKFRAEWDKMDTLGKIVGVVEVAQQASGVIEQLGQRQINVLNSELQEFTTTKEKEKAILEKQLENGTITQEQYEKRTAIIEEKIAEKQKEVAIERAKVEKAQATFNIIVNTAAAVVKAYASLPPPFNIVMAATIGALGMAQLAVVNSAPMPSFAKGGVITGETRALVGDNPDAGTNPEIGLYRSQLKNIVMPVRETLATRKDVEMFDHKQVAKIGKKATAADPYIVAPVKQLTDMIAGRPVDINPEVTREVKSGLTSKELSQTVTNNSEVTHSNELKKVIASRTTDKLKQIMGTTPALAAGGMVHEKTFAMIGDNLNAKADPEVVAPLSKLEKIISESITAQIDRFSSEINNNTFRQVTAVNESVVQNDLKLQPIEASVAVNVEVTGRITGEDIWLANKRQEIRQNRVR